MNNTPEIQNNNQIADFYYQDDEDEISIGELLGYLLRHIGKIIICCVIFTLVGIGFAFIKDSRNKNSVEQEPIKESLVLQLDPNCFYESKAIFQFGVDVSIFSDKFQNPSDYIARQYLTFFNGLNLSEIVGITDDEQDLRRLITGSVVNSAFEIKVLADTEENSRKYLNKIVSVMQNNKSTLERITFNHTVITSIVTQLGNPNVLKDIINSNNLKQETTKQKSSLLKYGIIGFALGFILSCGYYFIMFISNGFIGSIKSFEEKSDLRFLGSTYRKKKLEDIFTGDDFFSSPETAKEFTSASISLLKPFNSAVLVSTETVSEKTKKELASLFDCKVDFVENALINPAFFESTGKAEIVIALEKLWYTKERDISSLKNRVSVLSKDIKGFIAYEN